MNLRSKPKEKEDGGLLGRAAIRTSVEEPAYGGVSGESVSPTKTKSAKADSKQAGYMPFSKLMVSTSILLWGILFSLSLIPMLKSSENHYFEDYLGAVLLVLHGIFCIFGGASSLLKYPLATRFCLYGVSFCFVAFGLALAFSQRHAGNPALIPMMLGISAGSFIFGLSFIFVGRWLGHEED